MNQPITCTACGQRFQTWQNWLEHRAVIQSWEMHKYDNHTRRCLSEHDWAMMVLAEAQGIQEGNLTNRQEDVSFASL
jgi:hypothetical protein